ncbi:MAG: thioredoxin [Firmicutes bacterium]|nr:thioredoxin [Bacillota bacterium]
MIRMLDSDNFDEVVSNSKVPVLVDFYAEWCNPCKRIVPSLEEIAEEHADSVLVCQVNVDESHDLATAFQVMSIPNVISFKNGEFYKRVVGAVSKDELLDLVK